MWTEAKQQQLHALRRQAATGQLAANQQTLDQLLHKLEQDEWSALRPALDALQQEQGQFQAELDRVQALHVLLRAQYQALLARRD